MANGQRKHAIGVFPSRQDAQQALNQLREAAYAWISFP